MLRLRHPVSLLLICALVLLGVLRSFSSPEPVGADAPDVEFSALRSEAILRDLLQDGMPHVAGSPANLVDVLPVDEIVGVADDVQIDEGDALELRVSYDPEVGSDIWYFYFDPASYEMFGYRFYHDESKNDGEYITLEGEAEGAGLRLPKIRKWYRHQDEGYLGTDTIESIRKP